ncbi:hypothetical protein EBB07_14585 [Paenibacillaceae bacterium]|nr:hypothetical protein EBB07_14585 [Paenibacillaceae bacterium]
MEEGHSDNQEISDDSAGHHHRFGTGQLHALDEGNRIKTYTTGVGIDPKQETTYYSYDALNRLVGKQQGNERVHYAYDSLGNLISESAQEGTTSYTYNKRNQLIDKQAPDGAYTYRYDKRGNLVEELRGSEVLKSYTFDETNRLALGENGQGEQSRYIYNGVGMRVRTEQLVNNLNAGHQDGANSAGSQQVGSVEDLTSKMALHPQQTWTSTVGSTRQTALAQVNRDYVIDWNSPYHTDLMAIEEKGYTQRYVYGLSKIYQETTHVPGVTEPGSEGANVTLNIKLEGSH